MVQEGEGFVARVSRVEGRWEAPYHLRHVANNGCTLGGAWEMKSRKGMRTLKMAPVFHSGVTDLSLALLPPGSSGLFSQAGSRQSHLCPAPAQTQPSHAALKMTSPNSTPTLLPSPCPIKNQNQTW